MRAWAGIVLAVLAGGVLFFLTDGDDVAGELTSSRQSVYEIRPGDAIGHGEITPYFETVGVDPPKRPRS